jgi:hypothetical protein
MSNELLQNAQESFVSMASSYVPNEEEKKELKQFVELHVDIKNIKENIKNNTKTILVNNKMKKLYLKEYLKSNHFDILQLDDDRYVRLNKITKNNPITFEVLREAFQNFNEEKLNEVQIEEDELGMESFIEGIIAELKLMSKSINEQISITASVPRGRKHDTIPKADLEVNTFAQKYLQMEDN